eukprot:gnl/Hemi2/4421_TR1551_c0_g1_i1.p1 gnl/Hemi2/4421_TR1551_c0_g1~~gnl/Hemi2/4421_TR1551_c0_g1_i1.p1  ORF type:complete len:300 (+),score=100.18 gnl/Hemi2/4421_TR1551_c0_g1_i1:34-900(+)
MANPRHFVTTLAGVQMPRLIYGTAWKEARTTELVVKAVVAGFRGIDTACQPKHYQEDLVGAALVKLANEHQIPRSSLFLQTKFTSLSGQDPNRLPYDRNAPLADQVRQSFARSLQNLHTDYLDSLVLHGPLNTHQKTMQVWRVFEEFHASGKVKQLGISNCYDLEMLQAIFNEATVKPAVLQNRFYAESGYDVELRAFCRQQNIVYQSFWTLSANPRVLSSAAVQGICQKRNWTPAQVLFRFLIQTGAAPLTGTCNQEHMQEDLAILDSEDLSQPEMVAIGKLTGGFV